MLDVHVVKQRAHFRIDCLVAVSAGEACGLFGASGAGKSTTLACIAGTERPDDGFVRLGGETLFPPQRALHERSIGYLTQDANIFPHLRVSENVRFGLTNGARDENEAWVAQLRERLQLESVWNQPAHAISGGQARRVALARTLARKPALVLLDEPFSGLDRHLVRELLATLVTWQRELRFTMLVVDHKAEILERLCDRAIVLEEGRVVQDARWDLLHAHPATPLLAQLLTPL
ncbi:MAG TPA: ATP-binding cassette domain-containing protein [Candidatus Baltobacteraceae bacterium]